MGQRSRTLKHWWKRFRNRPAARRAMRTRVKDQWPHESAAYARLRAAGLSDAKAIDRLLAVLDRAWDRSIDAWQPFDDEAYVAELSALR